MLINCRGKLLDTSRPLVMGILNTTPDSFYDGGKFNDEINIRTRIKEMLSEGADIIDVGAVSSRPGSSDPGAEEEWKRLSPALKLLTKEFPQALISVDTFRPDIAEKSIDAGAAMINDIYAGRFHEMMLNTVARMNVPYVMMHMAGSPVNMQDSPEYVNVTMDIIAFFVDRLGQSTGCRH